MFYVYILSNINNTVLYVGVTNDLAKRVYEHKQKFVNGFAEKYNVDKLVYYEIWQESYYAISREKQIKGLKRVKKEKLINEFNPEWKDLYQDIL